MRSIPNTNNKRGNTPHPFLSTFIKYFYKSPRRAASNHLKPVSSTHFYKSIFQNQHSAQLAPLYLPKTCALCHIDFCPSLWYHYINKGKSADEKMSAVQMKENVKVRYGEDSHEFGYFMYVFSRRPLDWTIRLYNKLMEG